MNLRRALTVSDGDWLILVGSPLAICIWAIAIAGFVLPIFFGRKVKKRMKVDHSDNEMDEAIKGGD